MASERQPSDVPERILKDVRALANRVLVDCDPFRRRQRTMYERAKRMLQWSENELQRGKRIRENLESGGGHG